MSEKELRDLVIRDKIAGIVDPSELYSKEAWVRMVDDLVQLIGAHTATVAAEAERSGYDSALNLLMEWGTNWQDSHETPFNWYGAAKALLVSKEMQLPYTTLNTTHSEEGEV